MLLTAIMDQAKNNPSLPNYSPSNVKWSLRITAKGEFIELLSHKPPREVMVPTGGRSGSNPYAYSGFDTALYSLGRKDPKRPDTWTEERHEAFKQVLREGPGEGAKAILTYLENNLRDEDLQELASNSGFIFIEVEGFENWITEPEWQEYHSTRVLMKSRNGKPAVVGQCSLCLQEKELLRLFPEPRGHKLITFNAPAWRSYGHDAAFNAPTCASCVGKVTKGFEYIFSNHGLSNSWSEGYLITWWPTDASAPEPFPLLKVIFHRETSEEDRERALIQLSKADGHMALMSKLGGFKSKNRTAVRRHHQVKGAEVVTRLRRWLDTVGTSNPWHAAYQFLRKESEDRTPFEIQLYLHLISGEPFPARDMRRLLHLDATHPKDSHFREGLTQFLTNQPTEYTVPDNIEEEEGFAAFFAGHQPASHHSSKDKFSLYMGMLFGRAESLQWRATKPQRTIYDTSFKTASRDAERAWEVVERWVNKARDPITDQIRKAADEAYSVWDQELGKTPRKLNPRVFARGYRYYRYYQKAKNQAHRESEAAAAK